MTSTMRRIEEDEIDDEETHRSLRGVGRSQRRRLAPGSLVLAPPVGARLVRACYFVTLSGLIFLLHSHSLVAVTCHRHE